MRVDARARAGGRRADGGRLTGAEPELFLEADGVEVWRLDLSRARPPSPGELSAAEEARASRRAVADDRRRFAASRAALRRLIAARAGTEPGSLAIVGGPNDRPVVPGGPSFSVSHSGELWLCAVASGRVLGVDAEGVREVREAADIAARWFTRAERERLAAEGAAGDPRAFLRGWVRKEAFLKALGVGFSSEEAILLDPDPEKWDVLDLDPAPGFVGALVVNRQPAPAPAAEGR